jgi:hypothetical protein
LGAGALAERALQVVVEEGVVANDRRVRAVRHAGHLAVRVLVLDLGSVADGVLDQVVRDEAVDERGPAGGVAQVQTGAGAVEGVTLDDPVPGDALRRDADDPLTGVGIEDGVIEDRDVVRHVVQPAAGLDAVVEVPAVHGEVLEDQVAGVVQFDRVGAGGALDDRAGGAVEGDRGIRRAVHAGQVQPGGVVARGKRDGVTRLGGPHQVQVVRRIDIDDGRHQTLFQPFQFQPDAPPGLSLE